MEHIIKLTPVEADYIFPADEEGESLGYHITTDGELRGFGRTFSFPGLDSVLAEFKANAGPFPEDWVCSDWEYFNTFDEKVYVDVHGDELCNIARCKFGEDTILWVCCF